MSVSNRAWQDLPVIKGLSLGVAAAGIKYPDRNDLAVMCLAEGTTVAGVFTQNTFAAAPVSLCKKHLQENAIRALIVNSGNANACTGDEGLAAALRSCQKFAQIAGIDANQVLPFSTGVIGEDLPIDKIESALPAAIESADENAWRQFAEAIMTTDTRPKGASSTVAWQGQQIKISGVAKGSGMINPNMATMLAYIATDAGVDQAILNDISKRAANKSFNRITIDGDTSTNDSCILIATGKAEVSVITDATDPLLEVLSTAIIEVYQSLAKQIVEDGEGATKFVEVDVKGGKTQQECLNVAYAIAHSPLIKTALFASDPNWGRIVCAIGYADVEGLTTDTIRVWLDDVLIVENGGKADSYREEDGQKVFDQKKFSIKVDLGRGDSQESLWTTDLSHEYIRINAEYRS